MASAGYAPLTTPAYLNSAIHFMLANAVGSERLKSLAQNPAFLGRLKNGACRLPKNLLDGGK